MCILKHWGVTMNNWQQNPLGQTLGTRHNASLQPNQFQTRVVAGFVPTIPAALLGQPAVGSQFGHLLWASPLPPSLSHREEPSNQPWLGETFPLGREAAVQRGGMPQKHLILINRIGAFNSRLPPQRQGRTSCILVEVWSQRCSSMGWAGGITHRFLMSFSKEKPLKGKERDRGVGGKKALTN